MLTFGNSWRPNAEEQLANETSRLQNPVELWEARTGRFVARLQPPPSGDASYFFVAGGQWIVGVYRINPEQSLRIYSAGDGRPTAELKNVGKHWTPDCISPSGRTMATFCKKQRSDQDALSNAPNDGFYVQLWDTASWKPLSISGPFPGGEVVRTTIRLLGDDLFAARDIFHGSTTVIHAPTNSPLGVLSGSIEHVNLDRKLAMTHTGQLFDTRYWRRVQPPKGRRHHPDLAFFAPDSRFTLVRTEDEASSPRSSSIRRLTKRSTCPGFGASIDEESDIRYPALAGP